MPGPDVRIEPDAVQAAADRLVALADEVRGSTAAAEVDTVRPDAPRGFAATVSVNELWVGWSRLLDQAATDTALFGHNVHGAVTAWLQVDAATAATLGGG